MKEDTSKMCILNEVGCYANESIDPELAESLTAIEVESESDK